jgi:hypothetical protein
MQLESGVDPLQEAMLFPPTEENGLAVVIRVLLDILELDVVELSSVVVVVVLVKIGVTGGGGGPGVITVVVEIAELMNGLVEGKEVGVAVEPSDEV